MTKGGGPKLPLFGQCVWRYGFGFGFQRWDFYLVWPKAKGVCVLIWDLFRVCIFRGWVLRAFQNEFTGLCGRVCMSCVHV